MELHFAETWLPFCWNSTSAPSGPGQMSNILHINLKSHNPNIVNLRPKIGQSLNFELWYLFIANIANIQSKCSKYSDSSTRHEIHINHHTQSSWLQLESAEEKTFLSRTLSMKTYCKIGLWSSHHAGSHLGTFLSRHQTTLLQHSMKCNQRMCETCS
jgi:hypothetical protein